jgi:hypothetical protein
VEEEAHHGLDSDVPSLWGDDQLAPLDPRGLERASLPARRPPVHLFALRSAHIGLVYLASVVQGSAVADSVFTHASWFVVQVGTGDAARCLGRKVAIHLPSVLWMWPHPGDKYGEWNRTEILVQTPKKNYTAYDLEEMLTDMGLALTKDLWNLEKNDLLGTFEPPMIDTCTNIPIPILTPIRQ